MTALSIHPSGKVAVSTGADKHLKLWDLLEGARIHDSQLPEGSLVCSLLLK